MDRFLSAMACALALNLVGFTLPGIPAVATTAGPVAVTTGRSSIVMGATGTTSGTRVSARMQFSIAGDHALAEGALAEGALAEGALAEGARTKAAATILP